VLCILSIYSITNSNVLSIGSTLLNACSGIHFHAVLFTRGVIFNFDVTNGDVRDGGCEWGSEELTVTGPR